MKPLKLLGLALIVAGVLALVYHGFSYTKESHEAKLGPVQFSLKEKDHFEIPTWAGVVAIALGAGLILVPGKR
jgi:hypothetical protein